MGQSTRWFSFATLNRFAHRRSFRCVEILTALALSVVALRVGDVGRGNELSSSAATSVSCVPLTGVVRRTVTMKRVSRYPRWARSLP
jgi:hypothetical protein